MEKIKVYSMLKMLYPLVRSFIEQALVTSGTTWKEKIMEVLDDLFGKTDIDEINKAMIIIEWSYKAVFRTWLINHIPKTIISELDEALDYTV